MRSSSSAGSIGLVVVLFAITVLTFLIFFATPGGRPDALARRAQPDARDRRGGHATSSAWTARSPSSTR